MVINPISSVKSAIQSRSSTELALILTLVVSILIHVGYLKSILPVCSLVGCIIAIATGMYRTHWQVWLALFALFIAWVAQTWYYSANHFYLHSYWLLACCLALKSGLHDIILRHHGRMLIGLAMSVAAIQKLLTWDYISGSFFKFFMIQSHRFSFIPTSIGVLTSDDLEAARNGSRAFTRSYFMDQITVFPNNLGMQVVALVESWGIILIELTIGLLFLKRFRGSLRLTRDYLLLIFVVGTYFISPPDSHFGMIFICMALAQYSKKQFSQLKFAYFLAFIYLFFTQDIADLVRKAIF